MIKIFHEDITNTMMAFVYESHSYKRTNLEECDFIIHNDILWAYSDSNTENKLKELSHRYKTTNKNIIVFIVSDYQKQYQFYENLILLRTSLKASLKKTNELVMPYIWECSKDSFSPIVHQGKAHVGFCGLGSKPRKAILEAFSQSSYVKDNFIIRDKFWGGNPHDSELIADFQNNIKENAFVISQRGNGNFSMRFYQTLAAGRIPVLTNTDMILPFSDEIKWQNYIVFERNERMCLNRVINLFNSGEYIKMQAGCSDLFKKYFSEHLCLGHLINQICRQLETNEKQERNFIKNIRKFFEAFFAQHS